MTYDQEKYVISVYENRVEITGTLTIREAFDFLSFFEKEGYTTVEDWGDGTALYLKKRDMQKELDERLSKETLEHLSFVKMSYEKEMEKSERLTQKVSELEDLIRTLMINENEKIKSFQDRINELEKSGIVTKIKLSPEFEKVLNSAGFTGLP